VAGDAVSGARRKHPLPSIGDRSGKITVRGFVRGVRGGVKAVIVKCDCGRPEYTIDRHNLKNFRTTRCPICAKQASNQKRYWKYAAAMPDDSHRTRLLNRLSSAISRCHNSGNSRHKDYGGRGIRVHHEWREDRTKFLAYVQTLEGWDSPSLEMDRINNDKGYEPNNIRFATRAKTCETLEASKSCSKKLMTYDLAYAGPNNRFTIGTDEGPLIVHNCGYGMGPVRFQAQLGQFNVKLPIEECERIIKVYRATYTAITKLWKEAGNALKAMQLDKVVGLGCNGALLADGEDGILLPNGLYVSYPNLRVEVDEEGESETLYDTLKGRTLVPTRIYGGKVIENVCQALSRIVIGEQLLAVSKEYKVVMTVHDAIGALAPTVGVVKAMQRVEELMKIRPAWAPDLPLDCEGGYGESYGRLLVEVDCCSK